MRHAVAVLLLSAAIGLPAVAQTWDTSGNGMLNGTYYFRQVIWEVGYQDGSFDYAAAIYGNIIFDGKGNYSISNTKVLDSNNGIGNLNTTGTYSISASGYGFMTHPYSTGDYVYGLVSRGIFIASSTEQTGGFNDLLIAAPVPSPQPTNSFFSGSYGLFQFDPSSGSPSGTLASQIGFNADGAGGIGSVRVSGHVPTTAAPIAQTISGVKYFFSNGAANVNFGNGSSQLIGGTEYLYFSPDGAFVFGGSPNSYDMIVGVRSPSTTPSFSGLYYEAGVYQDYSTVASGYSDFDTYYGSLKAASGNVLDDHRLLSPFQNAVFDFTYSDTYTLKSDGSYDDAANHYIFGAGGAIRIGIGNLTSSAPQLGINVALQVPAFTPSGVFIDPTGIVNAASSALFTAGIAPGELITIYGSNLSASTVADATFPTKLAGVQVMINGNAAPIYVVSPGQISAVVPFSTSGTIASIQVINNGTPSNTISLYVNTTAAGVFTKPEGGIGSAAALHQDFTLVSSASPAKLGETISVYVTGLGAVSPGVADGSPGPTNPFSLTSSTFTVYIGGQLATTSFVGLAPQLIGLYQINVLVPTTVTLGNALLEIVGPDFTTAQATIPVGTGTTTSIVAPSPSAHLSHPRAIHPRPFKHQ